MRSAIHESESQNELIAAHEAMPAEVVGRHRSSLFYPLQIPDRKQFDNAPFSVGTDPNMTLKTRRGTGYYKVPSLKGVWYRSMFGPSGSCASLEDWFDPKRLEDDYEPTGFKPYGAKSYSVKGHPFGLDLSEEDRRALIAFLKTL